MTQPAILVIDVGTTVLKTSIFDFKCHPIARVARPHMIEDLNPAEAAERLWAGLKEGLGHIKNQHPGYGITAVGLTGFMHYVFPLDAERTVLPLQAGNAETHAGFNELLAHFGVDRIYSTMGSRLDPSSVPAQVLAWRAHQPRKFEKIATLLPVKDLLRYRLTQEVATDEIDACGTMFCDLHERRWDQEMLSHCGLHREALPCIRHCTEQAGVVTRRAAEELGLPEGVPVAIGGGDDIEILGSGVRTPRQVCEHVGSTGSFLLPMTKATGDPKWRLELYPAVARGEWVLGGSCSNVARALNWFLASSVFASDGSIGWDRAREELAANLKEASSDRPLFLPYLYGERAPLWQPDLHAQWIGLRHYHASADLLASVVEGICFSLRHVLESYKDLGLEIDTVYSSGGFNELGAQRMRATIYGKPIRLVRGIDPTSFAACAITLCALGELRAPSEAVDWLEFEPDVEPEPAWQAVMDERFACFLEYTRRVPLPLEVPSSDFFPDPSEDRKRITRC